MNSKSFQNSLDHLVLAEKIIPLGAQTFSKSKTQYPVGHAPFFIESARNAIVWDVDGNKFVDLVAALGAVTLGYRFSSVDKAVKKQLKRGVTFSLSTKLEYDVADLLIALLPDAEMVRFGKNGSDVTTAAVRVARHVTGRDKVIRSGYHGWQDWHIGSTSRSHGVPQLVQGLTTVVPPGNIEMLEQEITRLKNEAACFILEPFTSVEIDPEYFRLARRLCDEFGILLIFDEVLSGFRVTKHGASEVFGVSPDLSCFGKGMANGFPLSALVGKKKYMQSLSEVFFSGTFGGESLSLAAAKQVLQHILEDGFIEKIHLIGSELSQRVSLAIASEGANFLSLVGHPSWKFLSWSSSIEDMNSMKTLFLQEMLQRGVLVLGTHNIMLTLSQRDLLLVHRAYKEVLPILKECYETNNYKKYLRSEPIVPLFTIR